MILSSHAPSESMFEPSFFGPGRSPYLDMHQTGFIEHQAPEPKRPRGPIIEELNSDDDEKEEANKEMKEYPRKHGRSNVEPRVEVPDDEPEQSERRNGHLQYTNGYNSSYHRQQQQPQTRSFTFQSSNFTYGGSNGTYYTSSKTRRTGSDGVTFEESKEADTTTGQASHRVSRGLRDRGHSVMRNLNSNGRVDMMQTLHNLNQDELAGFEESWNRNAQNHLPGWSGSFNGHDSIVHGHSGQNGQPGQRRQALPSTERSQQSRRVMSDARDRTGSSRGQQPKMKGLTNFKDKSSCSQGN